MPRYFFHVKDGEDFPDLQGTVLDNLAAARAEAVRFAGALLSESHDKFWASGEWNLRVTTEEQLTLFQLTFFVTNGAAGSRA